MIDKHVNKKNRLITFANYLWHLSIKRRISLAILLAFALVLPVVAMSLFYFSNILQNINAIINEDVELGRISNDLSVNMLIIKRYERNYRALGSEKESKAVQRLIAEADSTLKIARLIAPDNLKVTVIELSNELETYKNSFSTLIEYVSKNPPEDRTNKIITDFTSSFGEFRTNYLEVLKKLSRAPVAQRDSIIAHAAESTNIFTYENIFSIVSSGTPDQSRFVQQNLENSSQRFLDKSKKISEISWDNMLIHREESLKAEARAQRNIISILIMTALISVIVITMLPKKIVQPITYFNRIMKRAGEGDFSVYADIKTSDEIGSLAANYNLAIEKLKHYDTLKTSKIASQKRITERMLEMIQAPVCIISSDFNAIYYNAAFILIFGHDIPPRPPEGGLNLDDFDSMEDFKEKIQKKVLNSVNDFNIETAGSDGLKHNFKGRIIRNSLMELESIIVLDISEKKC